MQQIQSSFWLTKQQNSFKPYQKLNRHLTKTKCKKIVGFYVPILISMLYNAVTEDNFTLIY